MTDEEKKQIDDAVDEYQNHWIDAVGLAYKLLRALHINPENIEFPELDTTRPSGFCQDPDCKACNGNYAEGHIY